MELNGGSISIDPGYAFSIKGGIVTGNGAIEGSLDNFATISPGDTIGAIVVSGDYVQEASGRLLIEIAESGYDTLTIGGNASLDGALDIRLLNGFVPTLGETFYVLSSSFLFDNRFADIEGLYFGQGERFDVEYSANGVTLVAVAAPEPTGIAMLAGVAVLLVGGRIRRRIRR